MELNKVVARFKDGTIKKGTTNDFFFNRDAFHLNLINGEIVSININELKALYFVKAFEGNNDHIDHYIDDVPGGGRKVQVTFSDGEVLIGFTQGYSPTRSGFFLIPADVTNNNERIYVVTSATEEVTFL